MTAPLVVLVRCPSCATEFPVDPAKVPRGGVFAACSKCQRVFHVEDARADAAGGQAVAAPRDPDESSGGAMRGSDESEVERPESSVLAGPTNGGAVLDPAAPPSGPAQSPPSPEGDSTPVDEAASDFEEWSNFHDLTFEPEEGGEEDAPPVGETRAAEVEPPSEPAPPIEFQEEEEAAPLAKSPETAEEVDVTSAVDTAADSEAASRADATSEVDTAAAREISSELEIDSEEGDESVPEPRIAEVEPKDEVGLSLVESERAEPEAATAPAKAGDASEDAAATAPKTDVGAGETADTSDAVGAPAPVFGRRDPHERAARLARVLASDIIAYNQEKYQQALEAGTLSAEFEEEIEKSWEEYVDQVGKEMAEGNSYFQDALNEILARGEKTF